MQRWDPKTADTRAGPVFLPPSEFVRNLASASAKILLILPNPQTTLSGDQRYQNYKYVVHKRDTILTKLGSDQKQCVKSHLHNRRYKIHDPLGESQK